MHCNITRMFDYWAYAYPMTNYCSSPFTKELYGQWTRFGEISPLWQMFNSFWEILV